MSVAYQIAEPSCHSYLGNSLKDSKFRRQFKVNPESVYEILLIPLPDVVLFPGETIPLRLQDQGLVVKVKEFIQTSELLLGSGQDNVPFLGVVSTLMARNGRALARYGTTLEVRTSHCESRISPRSHLGRGTELPEELLLTGKGQYRFQIHKIIRTESHGVHFAVATIFQDEIISRYKPHPATRTFPGWVYSVNSAEVLARRAYQLVESTMFWTAQSTTVRSRWGPLSDALCNETIHSTDELIDDNNSSGKRRRSGDEVVANICGNWHEQYQHQHQYKYGAELDPVGFSYFLSANLPLPTSTLQQLLGAIDTVDRLRVCIELIERGTGKVLACCVCAQPLAGKQQVFTVPGAEGVTGAYVNPHGAVHQTTTVRTLLSNDAIVLHGSPTAQDSWFPGYAWTIISCSRCFNHLGWKFTLVNPNIRGGSNNRQQQQRSLHETLRAALGNQAGNMLQLWDMLNNNETNYDSNIDQSDNNSSYSRTYSSDDDAATNDDYEEALSDDEDYDNDYDDDSIHSDGSDGDHAAVEYDHDRESVGNNDSEHIDNIRSNGGRQEDGPMPHSSDFQENRREYDEDDVVGEYDEDDVVGENDGEDVDVVGENGGENDGEDVDVDVDVVTRNRTDLSSDDVEDNIVRVQVNNNNEEGRNEDIPLGTPTQRVHTFWGLRRSALVEV